MKTLEECIEEIRIAFKNKVEFKRRESKMRNNKHISNDYTGYYGVFSMKSKKFVFGIQEETRSKAKKKCIEKIKGKWNYDFTIKKIEFRNKGDFYQGLKFLEGKNENFNKMHKL